MQSGRRFRLNSPNVVYELIEGEAVIVNLSNGMYYSIDGSAADIWSLLESGTAVPAIVAGLAERYKGQSQEIETAVDMFIAELQAERLVTPDGDLDESMASGSSLPAQSGDRTPFQRPILQKYIDMEDLLLLDPVHSMDES